MPIKLKVEIDAAPLGALQWSVAVMLVCVVILDGFDLQLAAFSAPQLMQKWELTQPQFSPLLAAALIGMAAGSLIGSWLGDRFGRRPTLIGSIAFFGAMTLLCATSRTPNEFLVWRLLSGLGFGAAIPTAATMMSEWMPERARGKAISVLTIGVPFGVIIGSLISSYLLENYGWQSLFMTGGVTCLVYVVVLAWKMPESPSYLVLRGEHARVHQLLHKAWGQQVGDGRDSFELEPPQESSGILFSAYNKRVNFGLWIVLISASLIYYGMSGWLTAMLVDFGFAMDVAVRANGLSGIATICGTLAVGWLVGRLGSRLLMSLLMSLTLVAATIVAVVALSNTGDTLLTVAVFAGIPVIGFCLGGVMTTGVVVASAAYDTEVRSRGVGVAFAMGRIGAILSSFLGGAVLAFAQGGGFFALVAVLAVCAAAGVFLIDRHIRRLNAAPPHPESGDARGHTATVRPGQ